MLEVPDNLREAYDALITSAVKTSEFLDMSEERAEVAARVIHEAHLRTKTMEINDALGLDCQVGVPRILALRQFLILRRALARDPSVASSVTFLSPGDRL